MRETVRSLRAYFILAGAFSIVTALVGASGVSDALLIIILLGTVATGVLFVVAGVRLPVWLHTRMPLISGMIAASVALQVLAIVYVAAVYHADVSSLAWRPVVAVAISVYLLVNARRLAKETAKPA